MLSKRPELVPFWSSVFSHVQKLAASCNWHGLVSLAVAGKWAPIFRNLIQVLGSAVPSQNSPWISLQESRCAAGESLAKEHDLKDVAID